MKEFTRSAKQNDTPLGDDPLSFKIGDDEFTVYPPTTAMFALFLSSQAENRTIADQMAGVVDLVDGLLTEEQRPLFHKRLLDRNHPLDFDVLQEIIEWLLEEWSARPTQESSDSSSSQRSGGRKSTAKRASTV